MRILPKLSVYNMHCLISSKVRGACYCYIARYTDMWNRHRESEIHDIHEIGSDTKLYYLWVKGYSTWGERHTIFLCWLFLHRQLSTQPTRGAHCAQIRLASPSSESQLTRSEAGTQLSAFSQISAHASGAWRRLHSLVPIPIRILFWHLWMIHPLRARVNTCAHVCTELTHALSRKDLILTKSKGKIYKTICLRNYITLYTKTT